MAHKKVDSTTKKSNSNLSDPILLAGVVGLVIVVALIAVVVIGGDSNTSQADSGNPVVLNAPAEGEELVVLPVAEQPQLIDPVSYQQTFSEGSVTHQLIDVRTPEEFAEGHIEGAVNIPLDEIGSRLDEVSSDVPVVLYCRSGNRSSQAIGILDQAGFNNLYDLGGTLDWTGAGFSLQR